MATPPTQHQDHPSSTMTTKSKLLFPPWNFQRWKAVDDRVRGGSSKSHLDEIEIDKFGVMSSKMSGTAVDWSPKVSKFENIKAARFWGTLDTQTLGGAGFASQRYIFGPLPVSLPRHEYRGIGITVLPDQPSVFSPPTSPSSIPSTLSTTTETLNVKDKPKQPHSYTLVLKTTLRPPFPNPPPPNIPPPPEAASLSYELSFEAPLNCACGHLITPETKHFPWEDFQVTYRGREVKRDDPRFVPLDSSSIYEISLMCRSNFAEQEGEFGIVVLGIEGWAKSDEKELKSGGAGLGGIDRKESTPGCWSGISTWLSGLWSGKPKGAIRLHDNEKEL